ncbi:serine protease easter-like isoform X2 [Anastrepha obliqua]|uniref:serine protease easter-like isoform X2 n=1 Tax=Anastrepha obliqua TaxID=95512 RepID=UPI0024090CF4|nr:serine protease easter-like isoform X2 [Anastrepha obliqua]
MEFAKCIVLLIFCGLLILTGIRADFTVGACLSYYAGIAYGDCIPIQDCPTLYEIALKPILLVEDVNLLRNSKCGSANNKFYVCCPKDSWLRQSRVSISVPESICQAPNGTPGVCKPIKGCSALMNIAMKEKIAPEEIIYLRSSLCGNANGNFMVCCPVAPNISENEVESTTVATVPKPEACQTPNGEPGECTSIRDCSPLVNLVTNPDRTEAETALLRKSQCGLANGTILVCCPLRKSVKIRDDPTTEGIFSTQSSSKGIERAQFPEEAVPGTENYRDTTESTRIPSKQNKCGRAVLSKRIFNGKETDIDEFPWTALLVYTNDYDKVDFLCGGALISRNYVLTAAHCADGYIAEDFLLKSVRLGEWNTRTKRDCQEDNRGQELCALPHRDVDVQRITIHPHYNSGTLTNDIALLRLAEYVDLTDFINVICLPLEASLQSELHVGAAAVVAGWGTTETSRHSSVKLKTTITVLNSTQCGVKKARRRITISDKQMCATGNRSDSCYGDSGGPLMLTESQNDEVSYYLIGLVSYGTGECGQKDTRGIYTRVGAYVDWIEDTMTK